MSIILCIETSSTNCSVALATAATGSFKNEYGIVHCLDLIEDQSASYSHGEKLHVYIQDILAKNNLTPKDLSAIAVSAGPGSYTGLRIGIASAKGLCYALDIPLLAIPTLQAIARLDINKAQITIPMLDARRMEVYAAVFRNNVSLEDATPVALELDSFLAYRKTGTVAFVGTGTEKVKNLVGETATTYFTEIQPTALVMCELAVTAYKKNDTVDVAYFEPLYLKEFKAG